jgi:peptidoglycan hydrolase-like protein with peptidoglycan-binding domain
MRDRGYNITVDGRFGKQSEKVAKVFQKRVGFKETGRVGAGLWKLAYVAPLGVNK